MVKIADSAPVPWAPHPAQPLSGVRVMSNTHVIAGTCSSRTLAEYGAQVLHIARDQSFEHEALVIDVNVGMRSAFVDLRNPDQNKRMKGRRAPLPTWSACRWSDIPASRRLPARCRCRHWP
nr:CoA transferase [Novosphingobium sp. PhB165]